MYGSKKAWRSAKNITDLRPDYSKTTPACMGIHSSDGECVNDPRGIVEVFKAHFSKLAAPSNDVFFSSHSH